jgi:hypothetical protein
MTNKKVISTFKIFERMYKIYFYQCARPSWAGEGACTSYLRTFSPTRLLASPLIYNYLSQILSGTVHKLKCAFLKGFAATVNIYI